ncbi:hypothetical protein WM32_04950 [Burkholderia ubonensis]|nr:hypothetical protein WM32_04950 [Burkholderia ubonensis]
MVSDMGQDVFEAGARVDPVELARADQAVHRRSPLAPAIGAGEQEVLATRTHAAQRSAFSAKALLISARPSSQYSMSASHWLSE